jgi:hypothetical protein
LLLAREVEPSISAFLRNFRQFVLRAIAREQQWSDRYRPFPEISGRQGAIFSKARRHGLVGDLLRVCCYCFARVGTGDVFGKPISLTISTQGLVLIEKEFPPTTSSARVLQSR